MNLSRHSLVWLTPEGWSHLLTSSCKGGSISLSENLGLWQRNNFPFIVTRQSARVAEPSIVVGFTLPLAMGKQRLAIALDPWQIDYISEPLSLTDAIPYAPEVWQDDLHEMAREAQKYHLDIRIYGSLAWQALTKLNYVHPSSDIDILIRIDSRLQLAESLQILKQHSQLLPLDGEFLFSNDHAVAWKELINESDSQPMTILMKTINSVSLVKKEILLKELSR